VRRWALLWAALLVSGCAGAPPAPRQRPAPPGRQEAAPRARTLSEATRQARARLEALRRGGAAPPEPGDDLVARYEDLLRRPGTPEDRKPEILLRLAELAFERETEALRRAYEGEADIPPRDRYVNTVGYYERLVRRYPDSPQALTAFYNLGYVYGERGEVRRAAEAYREVLRRDPDAPYRDEIHMRLGEVAFDDGRLEEAAAHYRAVVEEGKEAYRAAALYKLGWCFFNLERYPEAVEAFHRVLADADPSREDLRRETLEVLSKTLLEWGGLPALERYLADHPEVADRGPDLYRKLGDLFLDASRYDEAVATYAAGVEAYPTSALCLEMERGILAAYRIRRDVEAAMTRRESWVRRYGPGSAWDRAHAGTDLAAERDAMVEEGLRLAALYRHGRAQRGQGEPGRALALYRAYLDWFGDGSEAGYEMAYRYADALREAQRFREAADAYRRVAEREDRRNRREDAALRRIEVLGRLVEEDPSVLDEWIESHADFVRWNPTSPRVPEVLLAQGDRLLAAGRLEAAAAVYERLRAGHPASARAARSWGRTATCLFRLDRYAEAEAAARKALAAAADQDERSRARELVVFSVFKQGEAAEAAGRIDEANRHFLRLVEEFPAAEASRIALYRAAEDLRKAGRDREAAELYERLARTYPGSDHARAALLLASRIHEGQGDWVRVAQDREALLWGSSEPAEAADALFGAARAWAKAGRWDRAADRYAEFARRFPHDPRVAEAWVGRAEALEAGGGDPEPAYRAAWETPAGGPGAYHRARAALALARRRLERFRAVELRGDLEIRLAEKETLLEEALAWLTRAAGVPFADVVTEALYRAGKAFEHLKQALLESERPEGLSPEELEEYDFLLEERAFPLEERAVGFYQKGVAVARRAGTVTPWVERMFVRLEALAPWAYRRPELAVTAVDPPALPPAPEAER